jgi:hypothetical protein
MPTPLTPQALVLLQEETDYLDMGIPPEGSAVIQWNGSTLLIYNSASVGYAVTDISDLPSSTISQLEANAQQTAHGMIYYLPQSVEETVSSEATTAYNAAISAGQTGADLVTAVAGAAGKAAAAALSPLVGSLTPVLIVGGLVALFLVMREAKL